MRKSDTDDNRWARDSEIVRCKDCKHRPKSTGVSHDLKFPDSYCPCQYEGFGYSWMQDDEWCCTIGER